MKKSISIMALALLVILSCLGITACGGGGKDVTVPTQNLAQQQKPTGTASPAAQVASGGTESFGGIPIYPGAKEMFKIKSDQDEVLNDKPAVFESRMYTTSAKRADVAAFYKDKMPANGWKEKNWTEIGAGAVGSTMGQYDKNDGQAFALISCSDNSKDGGTVLKIDLKYVK